MGDVFDRWRLNCGWNPWDNETQDMAIASFVSSLDRKQVPAEAYNELYERFLETRAKTIQQGREIPRFGVDLLLAEWLGENGLANERRRRSMEKAVLPEYREKVCAHCLGTNLRVFGEKRGEFCDHLDESKPQPVPIRRVPVDPPRLLETDEEIIMQALHSTSDRVGQKTLQNALRHLRNQRYGLVEKPVENPRVLMDGPRF